MGRQHCLTGVIAGCGVAACVPWAPLGWRVLAVAVTAGASLLPDLDHPGATAARSLGWITRWVAKGVGVVSLIAYHATREPGDPAERESGHRLLTHTIPGAVLVSLAAVSLCLLHPVAGASLCALLAGLLALGMKVTGGAFAGVAGWVAWWLLEHQSGWWWLIPVGVLVGCVTHILGDTVTAYGTPLLWPLVSQGMRWRAVTTPATFRAGDAVESFLVAPLLTVAAVIAGGAAFGVWPLLWVALVGGDWR